jgi:hypothetical protein
VARGGCYSLEEEIYIISGKNTLVAIWHLMKKRIGRYAILLNGACLSLKINTCHIAAAGIASQPIY